MKLQSCNTADKLMSKYNQIRNVRQLFEFIIQKNKTRNSDYCLDKSVILDRGTVWSRSWSFYYNKETRVGSFEFNQSFGL